MQGLDRRSRARDRIAITTSGPRARPRPHAWSLVPSPGVALAPLASAQLMLVLDKSLPSVNGKSAGGYLIPT